MTFPAPEHVAIIMDGNGRWAKARNLPRSAGHTRGAETFRAVATACKNRGVKHLTVYAFSTENWKRPPAEITAILGLLKKYLRESIEKMEKDGIRLRFIGDTSVLPKGLLRLLERTDAISSSLPESCMQTNVCFNYGGRAEILRAARLSNGDEKLFEQNLFTAELPDPDLVIRTAGEVRLSNFLLWQSAYSEFVFSKTLWPDFGEADLDAAFLEFSLRKRRFGGL